MWLRRRAHGFLIHAPAKLNLFLEIVAKRADGFHEIETLMAPISLYDTLTFTPNDSGEIHFTSEVALWARTSADAAGALPRGDENLVVRAVRLAARKAGIERGADIRLVKRIAMAAGLAGGSSDAAAALLLANAGWQLGFSNDQLRELAAELGSDVPFFLGPGPAVCRGRGEIIEPLAELAALYCVVVCPSEGLSTAEVYRACRPADEPRSSWPLVELLAGGKQNGLQSCLHNRLQPPAEALSPWIGRLRDAFAETDVLGHQMSGSGTSYFGVCRNAAHARRVKSRLACRGLGRVHAVRTSPGMGWRNRCRPEGERPWRSPKFASS